MAGKETVYYRNLSGGQNSDSAPDILKDNQLSDARNASFSKLGAVSKRYGFRPLNAESYAKTVNRVIPWLRFDGTETLLAVMTDSLGAVTLNKLDPTTYAPTVLCTLNKADIGWFWWQDKFYFADGQYYRAYDGTTVGLAAPPGPGNAPTLASEINGDVDQGQHTCIVTFVNHFGVESVASASKTITIGESLKTIRWSDIAVGAAGTGVVKRRLYRSKAGTSSPLYLIHELNDNTTTSWYGDHYSDDYIEHRAVYVAPTRSVVEVSRCNKLVFHPHSQRVFASGDATDPGATYFSDDADPTEWRADWKLYSHAALGLVVSMSVFGDALAVHYEHGHMRWKGTDPASDLTWYQVPVNLGPTSSHATCLVPNALAFAAKSGVQLISPAALETDYILQPGESIVTNILKGKATQVLSGAYSLAASSAAYDAANSRYLLAYQNLSTSGANDSILVIDWTLGAVSVWDGFPANHLAQNKDGDVLVASDNYILRMTAGNYADWDTATGAEKGIAFSVTTKAYDLGYPLHRKKLSRLYIAAEQSTDSEADVTVTTEGSTQVFSNIDLSGTQTQEIYEGKCSLKGDRFSVTVSDSTIDAPLSIHGIGFRLKALTPKGTKVS